jgi:hypothetical protein
MSGFDDDDDESLFTDEDEDEDETQQAMPVMTIRRAGGAGAMPHSSTAGAGFSGMFSSTSSSPGSSSSPQTSPFRSSTLPLPGIGANRQIQAVTEGIAQMSTSGGNTPAAGVPTSRVHRGGMDF